LSRLLKNQEDIFYYLYRELPYSNATIDKVVDQYWKTMYETMTDETGLVEKICLTNFILFKRNLYADAKRIAKALAYEESKEPTPRNIEKINEFKQQFENLETQIKKRLHSKRTTNELPEN
jgi:hypothetical protein